MLTSINFSEVHALADHILPAIQQKTGVQYRAERTPLFGGVSGSSACILLSIWLNQVKRSCLVGGQPGTTVSDLDPADGVCQHCGAVARVTNLAVEAVAAAQLRSSGET